MGSCLSADEDVAISATTMKAIGNNNNTISDD